MTFRHRKMALRLVKDMTQRIEPDAAWVARTRERLVQRVQRTNTLVHPASLTWKARSKEFLLIAFPGDMIDLVRGPVMAVLSVIGLVLGGSIASVSASEQSIPGDLLYPVKLATEQARVLMQKDRGEKVKLKTEFVARRVEEIRELNKGNDPKKTAHIKEAVEILKNDLDTVKLQLHESNEQAPPGEAAETAKLVDQKSTEVASALKDIRADLSDESKVNVLEAESAAVSTGVKAVQAMIDSHQSSDAGKLLVTSEEIKQSIANKVLGLEEGIADATSKMKDIGDVTSSNATISGIANTSTIAATASSTASLLKEPLDQLKAARDSLQQTKQLLEQNNLTELKEKLGETTKAVSMAEKTVGTAVISSSVIISSNEKPPEEKPPVPMATTTTSTLELTPVASTTTATSTPPVAPSSTEKSVSKKN